MTIKIPNLSLEIVTFRNCYCRLDERYSVYSSLSRLSPSTGVLRGVEKTADVPRERCAAPSHCRLPALTSHSVGEV